MFILGSYEIQVSGLDKDGNLIVPPGTKKQIGVRVIGTIILLESLLQSSYCYFDVHFYDIVVSFRQTRQ